MRNRDENKEENKKLQKDLKDILFSLEKKSLIEGLYDSCNIGYSEWAFDYDSNRIFIAVGIGMFGDLFIHLKISLTADLFIAPTDTMVQFSEKWKLSGTHLTCKKGLKVHAFMSKECKTLKEAFDIALAGKHMDVITEIESKQEHNFLGYGI